MDTTVELAMNADTQRRIQISLLRASDDLQRHDLQYQDELRQISESLRAANIDFSQRARTFDSIGAHGYALGEYFLQHVPEGAVGAIIGAFGTWLKVRGGRRVRLKVDDIEAEAHTIEEIERLIDNAVIVKAFLHDGETVKAKKHFPAAKLR